MAIDILNVQPTAVSRDLKEKMILLYSSPKAGKTSFAAEIPKNLLLAFEKGYNALAGVRAIDITKWADVKAIVRQLKSQEAKEQYDTITFDTVGIAWDLCEKYICLQNDVAKIGDIPFGGGYGMAEKEFAGVLREIAQLGYGLVLIAHAAQRMEKSEEKGEILHLYPDLVKRPFKVVNALVDIIGYIGVEFDDVGNSKRYLYTRQTPYVTAGSRFKIPGKIPFGYKELTNALANSIQVIADDGGSVVDKDEIKEEVKRPFSEVINETREEWERIAREEKLDKANAVIERIFGAPIKPSSVRPHQQELLELLLLELKDI